MSDLQIVLIVIGGVIIAGVLTFNWWQERKFHQQIDKNFSAFEPEVMETTLTSNDAEVMVHEPVFDDQDFSISPQSFDEDEIQALAPDAESSLDMEHDALQTTASPWQNPQAAEETTARSSQHEDIKAIIQNAFEQAPVNSANVTEANAVEASSAPEPVVNNLPDLLHSQVDLVALLYLQGVANVSDVLASLKDGFSNYDKPTFVHAQTDLGWLLLSDVADKVEYANQAVSKISCSIQLADRAGPISRSVLNRFQLAVESLGLDMNAHVEWQSASDALNDANALDQFCIEVDKTMGFHLFHGENGAFTGTKLRGLAEAQGLMLAADGTFKYFDEAAAAQNNASQPSFVMFNRDQFPFNVEMLRTSVVKSVTFQLDIPHVKNCIDAFNNMVQIAKQMETGLNAQLVDDNNRPLTDAHIEQIRHQLKIIQATMLTRGIAPGSDCAHRLFS